MTKSLSSPARAGKLLSREDILAQKDKLQIEEVPVPEWGGVVRLRELTARERTQIELSLAKPGRGGQAAANLDAYPMLRGRILARSIVNEENRPLFTEADIEDLSELGAGPVEMLFTRACQMSGLAPRDVESMMGNSESTPNGASPSA